MQVRYITGYLATLIYGRKLNAVKTGLLALSRALSPQNSSSIIALSQRETRGVTGDPFSTFARRLLAPLVRPPSLAARHNVRRRTDEPERAQKGREKSAICICKTSSSSSMSAAKR